MNKTELDKRVAKFEDNLKALFLSSRESGCKLSFDDFINKIPSERLLKLVPEKD